MITNTPGIYLISCRLPDGHDAYYVGQSQTVRNRISNHTRSLRKGDHFNYKLNNLWKRHGESAFSFKLLESCSIDELDEAERWWLNETIGHPRVCNLGIDPVGWMRGIKHSRASVMKRAKAISGENHYLYGKVMPDEHRRRISEGGLGKKRGIVTRTRIAAANTGDKNPMFGRVGSKSSRSKPVTAACIVTGSIKPYESAELAELDGFHQAAISRCCNGKQKKHKGFYWSFSATS